MLPLSDLYIIEALTVRTERILTTAKWNWNWNLANAASSDVKLNPALLAESGSRAVTLGLWLTRLVSLPQTTTFPAPINMMTFEAVYEFVIHKHVYLKPNYIVQFSCLTHISILNTVSVAGRAQG